MNFSIWLMQSIGTGRELSHSSCTWPSQQGLAISPPGTSWSLAIIGKCGVGLHATAPAVRQVHKRTGRLRATDTAVLVVHICPCSTPGHICYHLGFFARSKRVLFTKVHPEGRKCPVLSPLPLCTCQMVGRAPVATAHLLKRGHLSDLVHAVNNRQGSQGGTLLKISCGHSLFYI